MEFCALYTKFPLFSTWREIELAANFENASPLFDLSWRKKDRLLISVPKSRKVETTSFFSLVDGDTSVVKIPGSSTRDVYSECLKYEHGVHFIFAQIGRSRSCGRKWLVVADEPFVRSFHIYVCIYNILLSSRRMQEYSCQNYVASLFVSSSEFVHGSFLSETAVISECMYCSSNIRTLWVVHVYNKTRCDQQISCSIILVSIGRI